MVRVKATERRETREVMLIPKGGGQGLAGSQSRRSPAASRGVLEKVERKSDADEEVEDQNI